jgi:hypothetical protein
MAPASTRLTDPEHDPDPKGRVSAKRIPGFPRDKRESVCAEIMLKQ